MLRGPSAPLPPRSPNPWVPQVRVPGQAVDGQNFADEPCVAHDVQPHVVELILRRSSPWSSTRLCVLAAAWDM